MPHERDRKYLNIRPGRSLGRYLGRAGGTESLLQESRKGLTGPGRAIGRLLGQAGGAERFWHSVARPGKGLGRYLGRHGGAEDVYKKLTAPGRAVGRALGSRVKHTGPRAAPKGPKATGTKMRAMAKPSISKMKATPKPMAKKSTAEEFAELIEKAAIGGTAPVSRALTHPGALSAYLASMGGIVGGVVGGPPGVAIGAATGGAVGYPVGVLNRFLYARGRAGRVLKHKGKGEEKLLTNLLPGESGALRAIARTPEARKELAKHYGKKLKTPAVIGGAGLTVGGGAALATRDKDAAYLGSRVVTSIPFAVASGASGGPIGMAQSGLSQWLWRVLHGRGMAGRLAQGGKGAYKFEKATVKRLVTESPEFRQSVRKQLLKKPGL